VSEVASSITYTDALGRPIQQVAQAASPGGKDVVQRIEYDNISDQDFRGHTPENVVQ
jgi:hypothetical protein